jgi:DNA modification methylase
MSPADNALPISKPSTDSAPPLSPNFNRQETRVLRLLQRHTYEEIKEKTGWSRGRIYNLAIRASARKTEARIRERHHERRARQVEFLQQVLNSTVKAYVLDFMNGLPNDSINLFLTSPPYNLGIKYGQCPGADSMRFLFYYGWLLQIISEMSRALKAGGVLFLNLGNTRDWEDRLMPLDVLLYQDILKAGLTFQSRIIWEVPHGLTPRRRLAERYETALVFSKGPQLTFNPTAARTPQKHPDKRAFKGANKGRLSSHPLGAHPSNIWRIPNVRHNNKEKRYEGPHPAQFPLLFAKRAVLLYSQPGDLVSDIFSGSGTTNHACIESGRAFVGADLFYEDLRARRLAEAVPDMICQLPGVTDESIAVWQAEARKVQHAALTITHSEEERLIQETFRW